MANRLALVVDDSKTARVTLKRMLEKQGLDVATLESAPEALDYLVSDTPDVIFMDHMMPGMDGFEAVEAIKSNPDTATIPIMMYTSKGGDLYVSQARALGAVGILPKQIQPAALFEVLNSLGLVKDRRVRTDSTSSQAVMMEQEQEQEIAAQPDSEDMQEIAHQAAVSVEHEQELHSQFGDLLIQHNSVIEEDLSEIKTTLARLAGTPSGGGALLSLIHRTGLFIPLVVLLVMLIPLIWLYKVNNETLLKLDIARNQAARLQASVQQLGQNRIEIVQAPAERAVIERPPHGRQSTELYNSLAWAVNLGGRYDVREEAFGDRRLAIVYELISRLTTLGFRGEVRLESHLGEFCLTGNEVDGFTLAPGDMPVRECSRFGHPLQQLPLLGERQSIAFANFLATSPLVNGSDIQLEIVAHGYNRPYLKYQARESSLPAYEWNRIAAANNRVNVILVPAESPG